MADGGLELDSAGGGLNRARGWSEEVWVEVERLGVRRIKAGQRGFAGATSSGVQLELCVTRTRGRRGDGREEKLPDLREDKGGVRRTRIAGMNDAWRARRRPQRRYGRRGGTVPNRGEQ